LFKAGSRPCVGIEAVAKDERGERMLLFGKDSLRPCSFLAVVSTSNRVDRVTPRAQIDIEVDEGL